MSSFQDTVKGVLHVYLRTSAATALMQVVSNCFY